MPGLVAVKKLPQTPPVGGCVTECNGQTQHEHSNGGEYRIPSPHVERTSLRSPSLSRAFKRTPEKLITEESSSLDNPDLGPFHLKLARDTIASGENPNKALDCAIRACKSFQRCAGPGPGPELATGLHVVAAIYASLGRFGNAVETLKRSIALPDTGKGSDHAMARFSGYMQLGDTYSMIGQLGRSISCYESGLRIQMEALGKSDPRIALTCRYLTEAHVQAMQFDEAENFCKKALEIHRENSSPASLLEAADWCLMALICEAKGDYESALEHLVLASMLMIASGQDNEVAGIDVSVGDIYLSLCGFDEAILAYQKVLTMFKATLGENHHGSVASVYIRLADLYYKNGKLRESKSCSENALRIYSKPVPGTIPEEFASGSLKSLPSMKL